MGTACWSYFDDKDDSEIESFEASIAALATMAERPELNNAPFMPIGFSNGGQFSYGLAAKRPEKVIAFIAGKGGYYSTFTPGEATRKVPGMLVAGETDELFRRDNIALLYSTNRALGALWAWAVEENTNHSPGNEEHMVLPFMAEAYRLRYPSDQSTADGPITLNEIPVSSGWLVHHTTWESGFTDIFSYAAINDDPEKDTLDYGWVLNEKMAKIYRGFSSYNKATNNVTTIPSPQDIASTVTYTPQIKSGLNWTQVEAFFDNVSLGTVDAGETPTWSVDFTFGGMYTFYSIYTLANGSTQHSYLNRVFIDGLLPQTTFDNWLYDNYAPEYQIPEATPNNDGIEQLQIFAFDLNENPGNWPTLSSSTGQAPNTLQFGQRSNLASTNVEIEVKVTTDLANSEWDIISPSDPAYTINGNTVSINLTEDGFPQHFAKVIVRLSN